MNFYFIYVREAHPTDGRQARENVSEKILVKSPTTEAERAVIASNCVSALKITIPCLVDNIENTTQKNYEAWPARACVIGTNGILEYISQPGPQGVDPEAIRKVLERVAPKADGAK